jgi:hypothetical protein
MTFTPNHNLDLIADGDAPWGQRMRDNLTSIDLKLAKTGATMWVLDNVAVTDIAAQNAPVKANIPNTVGICVDNSFSFSANRMTYTGTNRSILMVAAFTIDAVGNNKNFRIYLGHNGGYHQHSSIKVRDTSTGAYASGTITGVVEIANGDYLELWVANLTDSTDVVIVDLSMTVHG